MPGQSLIVPRTNMIKYLQGTTGQLCPTSTGLHYSTSIQFTSGRRWLPPTSPGEDPNFRHQFKRQLDVKHVSVQLQHHTTQRTHRFLGEKKQLWAIRQAGDAAMMLKFVISGFRYGGFHKWGYPQSSSIFMGFSLINQPFWETPICWLMVATSSQPAWPSVVWVHHLRWSSSATRRPARHQRNKSEIVLEYALYLIQILLNVVNS